MSRASEWAGARRRSEDTRPSFRAVMKEVAGAEEEMWGRVTDDGEVFLAFEDQQVTIPQAAALIVARWILATCGEAA